MSLRRHVLRDFILSCRAVRGHPSQMGTTNGPAARVEIDRITQARRETKELSDADARRHRFQRDTPEYRDALEHEEHLVSRIWRRLRADGQPASRTPIGD